MRPLFYYKYISKINKMANIKFTKNFGGRKKDEELDCDGMLASQLVNKDEVAVYIGDSLKAQEEGLKEAAKAEKEAKEAESKRKNKMADDAKAEAKKVAAEIEKAKKANTPKTDEEIEKEAKEAKEAEDAETARLKKEKEDVEAAELKKKEDEAAAIEAARKFTKLSEDVIKKHPKMTKGFKVGDEVEVTEKDGKTIFVTDKEGKLTAKPTEGKGILEKAIDKLTGK